MPHLPAHRHLDDLERRVAEITAEVNQLVAGLEGRGLGWQPAPDRWSVAHCLDHLAIVAELYLPRLREAVEGRRRVPAPQGGLFEPGWFGRWFARAAGPEGRRIRAPRAFRPQPRPADDAVPRFRDAQRELRRLVNAARGVDLNRSRVRLPVIPLLTLSVGECLEMLVNHERRHLEQALAVSRHPEHPAAGAVRSAPAPDAGP